MRIVSDESLREPVVEPLGEGVAVARHRRAHARVHHEDAGQKTAVLCILEMYLHHYLYSKMKGHPRVGQIDILGTLCSLDEMQ